jgi:hypothetical protein
MQKNSPSRRDQQVLFAGAAVELGLLPLANPTERIRYVNTASTAGGDGTTNATAGANRAYATLAAAVSGEAADLVSLNVWLHIYCEGTAIDVSSPDVTGYTTSEACRILIECSSANRHSGKWTTAKYRLGNTFSGLNIQEDYVTVQGLQIIAGYLNDDHNHHAISIAAAAKNVTVRDCILRFDMASQALYGGSSVGVFWGD